MTVFRWVTLLLVSLLLAACSGKPSDAEAERLFAEQNKQLGIAELFDIENVKRVNGFEQGQRYVVEIQFDLVARMSSDEMVIRLTEKAGTEFFAKARLNSNLEALRSEFGTFEKGKRFTKKRSILLQRTETGWALAV